MPKRVYILTLGVALSALIFSCGGPKHDFSSQLSSLDSLKSEVASAQERFDELDASAISGALKTIKSDMASMNLLSHGAITEAEAEVFSEYNRAKRLIKDFPQRHRRISEECERTLSQLTGLSDALRSGATQDAQGNKITPEYVKKNYDIESRVASSLIEEANNTIDFATRGLATYNEMKPQVDALLEQWKNEE
ncbi:hypothetical protein [Sanyastnella coralliicola]|uniref:hypothetical protein n=1 Tax=Sanyastnella coralliicola TaxID=3069118 RepID=UPI0027BA8E72|nr:hypothetical protein [Longitalea sp. SCSIO 12813]